MSSGVEVGIEFVWALEVTAGLDPVCVRVKVAAEVGLEAVGVAVGVTQIQLLG
jgi:hypothetical protein